MERFGSSLFRIVWASACLLLTGLVWSAVQGVGGDGSQIVVFGAGIPLGMQAAQPYVTELLGRAIYTALPAVLVLGAFFPLAEWIAAPARGERFKGLSAGLGLGLLHGLFLTQTLMFPVLAASHRLLGTPFAPALLQADLKALFLGLQLLLWALALSRLVKSNRGVALLLAYALAAVGKLAAWIGEYGADLELQRGLVKGMTLLGRLCPTESLPTDPLAWTALPLSLGGPLLLAALLLLLPGRSAAKAPAKAKGKKA